MAWTWDKSEQLRTRKEKVEDLGEEKQQQRFGEVSLNPDDGEGHPGQIA